MSMGIYYANSTLFIFIFYFFMEMEINTREGLGWCDPNLQLSSTLNTKNGRKAPESTS